MMVVRHRGKVLKDLLLNNSTKSFNVWIRNIDTNELFGLNSDQAEIWFSFLVPDIELNLIFLNNRNKSVLISKELFW